MNGKKNIKRLIVAENGDGLSTDGEKNAVHKIRDSFRVFCRGRSKGNKKENSAQQRRIYNYFFVELLDRFSFVLFFSLSVWQLNVLK